MRILKMKQNGHQGKVLLSFSSMVFRPSYSTDNIFVFDQNGIDDDNNAISFRVAISKAELEYINKAATSGEVK